MTVTAPATAPWLQHLRAVFALQHAASRAQEPIGHAQRLDALEALLSGVLEHEDLLVQALDSDFGHRSAHETRLLEIIPLVEEIRYIQRHLRRWMRPRPARVNWQFLPSRARIIYQPLGVVGVIGAWNYQLLLTLSPLANALAAGNHVMVKPSELAPATASVIDRMLHGLFPEDHVAVVTGGAEIAAAFAALPFDHLLFTGSGRVGTLVMKAAAENLMPVTLELGGKSPALVHEAYPVQVAADRICSAKFWNAGQTCIAPDYVLVPSQRVNDFVREAVAAISRRFERALSASHYTGMINEAGFERMRSLADDARAKGATVLHVNPTGELPIPGRRAFLPTLVLGANESMRVMQEEIFGPILPIVGYRALDQAIAFINARPRPLALYYFDKDRRRIDHVLQCTVSGGVVVNDCIFHMPQHALPFGGVGASGMGAYHGFDGFETFSKKKGVLLQHEWTGSALARLTKPPYDIWTDRLISFLIRRGSRSVKHPTPSPSETRNR
ncbi:coniferyl aldehyde dehydrogenase [Azohydromonas caseinilytica]|uniref:Aldehyde dehydrogenase n=1 Tax=Azohydromonas caseinilytica TaxID=2728836 RepID=A0A848FGE9_9BURK|nr:coniferyl aldehyde dehydrogenase [Azohydromonas caseinilytica]NML18216.1 coniferyl aldehyde dehydrogenase [Azohydromonas caseinilytica]